MSELTQVLISLAAAVYLGNELKVMVTNAINRTIKQSLKELNKLHHTTQSEIESSFELWWDNGPKQKARDELINKMTAGMPGEVPRDYVERVAEPMIPVMLQGIQELALHLAIHARMGDKEEQLMARLPKVGNLREKVAENRAQHEKDLDSIRADMLDHGINPIELETHFAKAA